MSIFTKLWDWFKKNFNHITQDLDKVAITVTQQIKVAAESKEAGFLAKVVDGLVGHGIAADVLGVIRLAAAKALAIETAILLPPGGTNTEEFLEWEQKVLDAIGVHKDKSVIWTRITATVIRDVQAFTQDGSAVSFAEAVMIGEDAYQTYKEELPSKNDTVNPDPVPPKN